MSEPTIRSARGARPYWQWVLIALLAIAALLLALTIAAQVLIPVSSDDPAALCTRSNLFLTTIHCRPGAPFGPVIELALSPLVMLVLAAAFASGGQPEAVLILTLAALFVLVLAFLLQRLALWRARAEAGDATPPRPPSLWSRIGVAALLVCLVAVALNVIGVALFPEIGAPDAAPCHRTHGFPAFFECGANVPLAGLWEALLAAPQLFFGAFFRLAAGDASHAAPAAVFVALVLALALWMRRRAEP